MPRPFPPRRSAAPPPDPASAGLTFAIGRLPISWGRGSTCVARGFDAVLFVDVDSYTTATGFALTAEQQLAYNRSLAAAAHARGLAAGIANDLAQAPQLAPVFDFAVADRCVAGGDCADAQPFLAAGKPVYLVAYTNRPAQMDAYYATARASGAPLILKTMSLNGKLHRRCAEQPALAGSGGPEAASPSAPPVGRA